jgi:ketosteroid isomerase-like protein
MNLAVARSLDYKPDATGGARMHATIDRKQLARDCYDAYGTGDRSVVERLLSDDFTFFSPADVGIDRAAYFERCWPNSGRIDSFEYKRLVESCDEVVVTYEATRTDGSRFRNTEVLTFAGDKIRRAEVYFGWDL